LFAIGMVQMKKDWFTFEDLDRFCENLVPWAGYPQHTSLLIILFYIHGKGEFVHIEGRHIQLICPEERVQLS